MRHLPAEYPEPATAVFGTAGPARRTGPAPDGDGSLDGEWAADFENFTYDHPAVD